MAFNLEPNTAPPVRSIAGVPKPPAPQSPGASLYSGNNPRGVAIVTPKAAAPPGAPPRATPSSNGSAPSGIPGGGGGSSVAPLDATSLANIAMNIFKANQSIGALQNAETQGFVGYQATAQGLAHQQPIDQLKLETGANQRGGLYSSGYEQQAGNLDLAYASKLGSAWNKYINAKSGNDIKIAGLQAGIPIYNEQQSAGAAARLAALAAKAPLQAPSKRSAAKQRGNATGRLLIRGAGQASTTSGTRFEMGMNRGQG